MIIFALVVVILYVITFLMLIVFWNSIPPHPESELKDQVTIIVAMRNEEECIPDLAKALSTQTYTNFSLILVDDHSTDATKKAATEALENTDISWKIIELPDGLEGKKPAIDLAVSSSNTEWILVTDADCRPDPDWIASTVSHTTEDVNLIAGPVSYGRNGGFWNEFLELDLISLIGITGACINNQHPLFINGANMAFRREKFIEVDPYKTSGNASGDDVYLMRALHKKYPGSIIFNKDSKAMITTQPPQNWSEFYNQRIRWSSKMGKGSMQPINLIIGVLIFLTNLILPITVILAIVQPMYRGIPTANITIAFWALKILVDAAFFKSVLPLYGRRLPNIFYFYLIDSLHVFYVLTFGILSRLLPYRWKSRKLQ